MMKEQATWPARRRREWYKSLDAAVEVGFGEPEWTTKVTLIFSSRPVLGIYALCEKQDWCIGLFPEAAKMGSTRRVETLIHELCHLTTAGRHGARWKLGMLRAATRAQGLGHRRLSEMIRLDVEDYQQREVDVLEVTAQLELMLTYADRSDYSWIRSAVADWAGWGVKEFEQEYPWFPLLYRDIRATLRPRT